MHKEFHNHVNMWGAVRNKTKERICFWAAEPGFPFQQATTSIPARPVRRACRIANALKPLLPSLSFGHLSQRERKLNSGIF